MTTEKIEQKTVLGLFRVIILGRFFYPEVDSNTC